MSGNKDINTNKKDFHDPAFEDHVRKEIWETVLRKNSEKLGQKKPSDSEEENIRLLAGMTLLPESEIRHIAVRVRKRLYAQRKQIQKLTMKQKGGKIKLIISLSLVFILVAVSAVFIGRCIKDDSDADKLCEAASNGDYDRITFLLEKGAYVDATDYVGRTALMHAVESGHTEIVKILLEHGAHPMKKDDFNESALDRAELQYREELINLLGKAYAESTPPGSGARDLWDLGFVFTGKSFHKAAGKGNREAVTLFVHEGMNPLDLYNGSMSALEIAVMYNYPDIVQFFLTQVPGKTTEQVGEGFLDAVKAGKLEMVRIFLEWDIDLAILPRYEVFPLLEVTDFDIMKLLLEKGVDVNARDKYGSSALIQTAVEHTLPEELRLSLVRLLLEYGADPNVRNKNGRLIDQAIAVGNQEIISLLYQAGAEE